MAKVVNSAEAWADTPTPMPAQESWSHQGSLGLVSLVRGSSTRALSQRPVILSQRCGPSMVLLINNWSIIPALPT